MRNLWKEFIILCFHSKKNQCHTNNYYYEESENNSYSNKH